MLTEKRRTILMLSGALSLVEGLSLFTFGFHVKTEFQALAYAYLDQVSMMTEGLLSPEIAKMLADGQNWMLVGGAIAVLGLIQLLIALRAATMQQKQE